MIQNNKYRGLITIIVMITISATLLSFAPYQNAYAHQTQLFTIGDADYLFEVGSLSEPVFVDNKNGVYFAASSPNQTDTANSEEHEQGTKPTANSEEHEQGTKPTANSEEHEQGTKPTANSEEHEQGTEPTAHSEEHEQGTKPIVGLENMLKVELAAGDKKKVLNFEPDYQNPGHL